MPNCPISPIMPSKSICTRFQIDIYLCFAALSSTLLQPLKSIFCTSDKCTECLLIISSLACFLRNSCLMPPQFRMTLLSASMLIIHKPSGCEFCCKQKHLKRCTNFLFVYLSYIISKSTFFTFYIYPLNSKGVLINYVIENYHCESRELEGTQKLESKLYGRSQIRYILQNE